MQRKINIDRTELFTDKDMVSFGKYLLSKKRMDLIKGSQTIDVDNDVMDKFNHPETFLERFQSVSHADFENWKSLNNNNKIS
jgi:hypothetical protein